MIGYANIKEDRMMIIFQVTSHTSFTVDCPGWFVCMTNVTDFVSLNIKLIYSLRNKWIDSSHVPLHSGFKDHWEYLLCTVVIGCEYEDVVD